MTPVATILADDPVVTLRQGLAADNEPAFTTAQLLPSRGLMALQIGRIIRASVKLTFSARHHLRKRRAP